ncbi:unnamed protein product [Brassica oleracea]
MCACSAASVNVVDGLKTADSSEKCPLCRDVCVYKGAFHLDELNILFKRRIYHWCGEKFEQDECDGDERFSGSIAAENIGKKGVKQRGQKSYSKPRSIEIVNAEASLEYNNLVCERLIST